MMPELHPKDTARKAYIRLLRERADSLDTLPTNERRTAMYAELIADGHLTGVTSTDEHGVPNRNVISGITAKGRLFLQDLEEQERSRSFIGRLKASWPLFSGLVGVIVGWLLSSWHPFAQRRDSAASPASQQQNVTAQPAKATPAAATPAQQTTPKP